MASGFAVWFGVAYSMFGEISIASTGQTFPCMYAIITSMFVPLIITVVISLIKPASFDWDQLARMERVDDGNSTTRDNNTKTFDADAYFSPEKVRYMKRMSRIAAWWALATVLGQVLLWPLPMYGAKNIMSKGLFIAWVTISLIWLFLTLIIAIFYPLVDGGITDIWEVIQYFRGKQAVVEEETSKEEGTPSPPVEKVSETQSNDGKR